MKKLIVFAFVMFVASLASFAQVEMAELTEKQQKILSSHLKNGSKILQVSTVNSSFNFKGKGVIKYEEAYLLQTKGGKKITVYNFKPPKLANQASQLLKCNLSNCGSCSEICSPGGNSCYQDSDGWYWFICE